MIDWPKCPYCGYPKPSLQTNNGQYFWMWCIAPRCGKMSKRHGTALGAVNEWIDLNTEKQKGGAE